MKEQRDQRMKLTALALLLRRLRGIIGAAISWAVIWLPVGIVLLLVRPANSAAQNLRLLTVWELWGACSGVVFAIVLAVAERNHILSELSLMRVTAWGAVGAIALPIFLTVAARLRWTLTASDWLLAAIVLGVGATLGAVCAAVTFSLAQRGQSA